MVEETVHLGGVTFPDDPDILRPAHRRSLRRGNYEKPERKAMEGLLRPEDRALEIGSGVGFISTLMARDYGLRDIHSYEANPALIPYIRQVHKLNGVGDHVTCHNALIAPGAGAERPFYVRGDFIASSLSDDRGDRFGGVKRVVNIPQIAMADAVAKNDANILICDIEGAEVELLPQIDLSRFRAAVVELHPKTIGIGGVQKVMDAFSAAGLGYDADRSDHAVVTFQKIPT